MENRLKNISNFIYPLGTSYLIFHNDTWNKFKESYNQDDINFLEKLGMLEDVKNIHNIGFYKIFKTSNNYYNSTLRRGKYSLTEYCRCWWSGY